MSYFCKTDRHGKVPWEDLFTSAIRVAEGGFEVTDLLYSKLVVSSQLRRVYRVNYSLMIKFCSFIRNLKLGLKNHLNFQKFMHLQEQLLALVTGSRDPL